MALAENTCVDGRCPVHGVVVPVNDACPDCLSDPRTFVGAQVTEVLLQYQSLKLTGGELLAGVSLTFDDGRTLIIEPIRGWMHAEVRR